MPSFKHLEMQERNIEQRIEDRMERGHEFEVNRERYQELYERIECSNMEASEKQILLLELRDYLVELQDTYETEVEDEIEEAQEERAGVREEVVSNLEAARESADNMSAFETLDGVNASSFEQAKEHNQDNISAYDDLLRELDEDRQESAERLENQRSQVMRDFFRY